MKTRLTLSQIAPESRGRPAEENASLAPGVFVRALGLAVAISILGVSWAGAQYISPVADTGLEPIPDKETFEERIDDARWTFGALKVQPWIGLRDASYVTDQSVEDGGEAASSASSQLTVTAGAGIRAYLRSGPKMLFTVHALPEYVWWQDNDAKSVVNGRYGAGMFAFWNRLRLELSFRRVENQGFFSPELQVLTSTGSDIGRAAIEVDVARGFTVYGNASTEDFEGNSDDERVFTLLDREIERLGVGVRFESARGSWTSLGYEDSSTTFGASARNLSNEGTAVLFGAGFERSRLAASLNLGVREIEPVAGSLFQPFDDVTGRAQLQWNPREKLTLRFFAEQSQGYSVDASQSSVLSRRFGATTMIRPRSMALILTASTGQDELMAISSDLPERNEDVDELRAQLQMRLGDLFRLELHASHLSYDSPLAERDRDITRYGLAVELGRALDRLRFGDGEGDW